MTVLIIGDIVKRVSIRHVYISCQEKSSAVLVLNTFTRNNYKEGVSITRFLSFIPKSVQLDLIMKVTVIINWKRCQMFKFKSIPDSSSVRSRSSSQQIWDLLGGMGNGMHPPFFFSVGAVMECGVWTLHGFLLRFQISDPTWDDPVSGSNCRYLDLNIQSPLSWTGSSLNKAGPGRDPRSVSEICVYRVWKKIRVIEKSEFPNFRFCYSSRPKSAHGGKEKGRVHGCIPFPIPSSRSQIPDLNRDRWSWSNRWTLVSI